MNIKQQLLEELSKYNINNVASFIGNQEALFKELMVFAFSEEDKLSLRASWVSTIICDSYPEMIFPFLEEIATKIKSIKHSGIRRNLLRSIANIEIPERLQGIFYDISFQWMLSSAEPPALRVFCMQIIYNTAKNEPDLLKEFALVLKDLLGNSDSAGIKSRANNILKQIRKLYR
jgi:hypothetical protein